MSRSPGASSTAARAGARRGVLNAAAAIAAHAGLCGDLEPIWRPGWSGPGGAVVRGRGRPGGQMGRRLAAEPPGTPAEALG